jgi:FAD/FMN-containing dehydrogenase
VELNPLHARFGSLSLAVQSLIWYSYSRNDAPSGLLLNIAEMNGIRILESFIPTMDGAEPVTYKTNANTIIPVPGKQAAATVGGGVIYREFNKALRASGLYSTGAAHGL